MSRAKHLAVAGGFVFFTSILVVIGLILVAIGRTLMMEDNDFFMKFKGVEPAIGKEDFDRYVDIMAKSIRFKTVSKSPGNYDREELLKLQEFLRESFPSVFENPLVTVETINTYSLLFTVKGSDPSLKPYMLTSHLDVVPVVPERWSRPPFLGEIVPDPETGEDCIWGRGAIDVKSSVVGILSALDLLFQSKWTPTNGFYIAFGHDEEVTGNDGAGHIGQLLQERNVSLEFLLDEGIPIIQGIVDGIDVPVAVIGVTEKGRMEVKITAEGQGGHSSIPPHDQAVEKLSRALTNLYKYPQPSMFGSGVETDTLTYLAPKMHWPYKLLFGNTWLFNPILSYEMSRKSQSNALIRTTTAATIIRVGVKENIVPDSAYAIVNHRIHPSQSLEDVLAHDIASIGDDQIKVEMLEGQGPLPISPYGPDSVPYRIIGGAVKHAYPDAVVSPGLMIANTDTKSYLSLTPCIYRLIPVWVTQSLVVTIHGNDERISLSTFKSVIMFYRRVIQSAEQSGTLRSYHPGRKAGEL